MVADFPGDVVKGDLLVEVVLDVELDLFDIVRPVLLVRDKAL